MPRKSPRKAGITSIDIKKTETNVSPVKTTKRGQKAVKIERAEVVTKVQKPTTSRKAVKKEVIKEEEDQSDEENIGDGKSPGNRKIKQVKAKAKTVVKAAVKGKPSAKRKVESDEEGEGEQSEGEEKKQTKKKRKTKEEKEAEAMPLAARTLIGSLKKAMHIGAHVSGAGGVHKSIYNALHIGGNSFALFLKSQRKWANPPLAPEARDNFKAFCLQHQYDAAKHVLPHGSYLVNLAQADGEKATQAYDCFVDDLQRCEELGIMLYNFHPGSTGGNPRQKAIARIAKQLNKGHKATKTVVTLLENMAGSGNVIGSTWEDLRDIIGLVEDKSRVGVCIDTCHAFAAGYDLRNPSTFEKSMESFKDIVGLQYLRALHINDSKAPFASNRDLHANIGTGFLGLRAFHNVLNYEPFQGIPMVLETPIDRKGEDGKTIEDKGVWAKEIKLLEGLIGMDVEGEVFREDEKRLADEGKEERAKFQGQVDRKKQKTLDEMFKKASPKKGKKKVMESEVEGEDSEGGYSH